MGDKSPKSKLKGQKQKNASKQDSAAKAKAKQARQGQQAPDRGKK